MIQEICSGYCINVVLPREYEQDKRYPALFLNDGDKMAEWNFEDTGCIVFGIVPKDRLTEYTPWKANAIRKNAKNFGGECEGYLQAVKEIVNAMEEKYRIFSDKIIFGGFSLGGLAAVYSLYRTERFSYVFSICGSFWFPDFCKFIETEKLLNKNAHLFMLNGYKEGSNHQNILENAPQNAQSVHAILASQIRKSVSVFDEYGHHEAMENRVNKVKIWLKSALNDPVMK